MKKTLTITLALSALMILESNEGAKACGATSCMGHGQRVWDYPGYLAPLCRNVCSYDLLGNPYNCGSVCN